MWFPAGGSCTLELAGSDTQGRGQTPQAGLPEGLGLGRTMLSQHGPPQLPAAHCNWLRSGASMHWEAACCGDR